MKISILRDSISSEDDLDAISEEFFLENENS